MVILYYVDIIRWDVIHGICHPSTTTKAEGLLPMSLIWFVIQSLSYPTQKRGNVDFARKPSHTRASSIPVYIPVSLLHAGRSTVFSMAGVVESAADWRKSHTNGRRFSSIPHFHLSVIDAAPSSKHPGPEPSEPGLPFYSILSILSAACLHNPSVVWT